MTIHINLSIFLFLHSCIAFTSTIHKHSCLGNQRFETKHGQTRLALSFINGHHPEVALLMRENVRMAIDVLLRGGALHVLNSKCLEFIKSDTFKNIFKTSDSGVYGKSDVEEDEDWTSDNACRVVTKSYVGHI